MRAEPPLRRALKEMDPASRQSLRVPQPVEERRAVGVKHDLGTVTLDGLDLGARRGRRHHDDGRAPGDSRGPRHGRRVVPGGHGDEAPCAFRRAERQDLEPVERVEVAWRDLHRALVGGHRLFEPALAPREIAQHAMAIAAEICIYTNANLTIEEL